jgi:hypothetical protein
VIVVLFARKGDVRGGASGSSGQREASEQYVSDPSTPSSVAHYQSNLRLRSNSSIARQKCSSSEDDKLDATQLDRCAVLRCCARGVLLIVASISAAFVDSIILLRSPCAFSPEVACEDIVIEK